MLSACARTVPGMSEHGPAVELIWWDDADRRFRWTYRAPAVHRGGWAWTWELAEQALTCARSQGARPQLSVRPPVGRVDRLRYRLGRGPERG